jgi:hypothetical protein
MPAVAQVQKLRLSSDDSRNKCSVGPRADERGNLGAQTSDRTSARRVGIVLHFDSIQSMSYTGSFRLGF